MFSGKTGAVVASGYGPVTTEPTYELARDATKVVRNLPSVLFDTNVKHRPCGLLCKLGAAGMLICDILGLPLTPWALAEPIGKEAARLMDKISTEGKKAKKAAKRIGKDAQAAEAEVLRRHVKLPLPTAAEIAKAWRQISKAEKQAESEPSLVTNPPTPNATPAPPAPPAEGTHASPAPLPAPTPTAPEKCSRARALIEAAYSEEAGVVILAAYGVLMYLRGGEGYESELEIAEVALKHALRALMRVHRCLDFFVTDMKQSALAVAEWTLRLAACGEIVPAAVRGAEMAGYDLCAKAQALVEARRARDAADVM